jgi:hypothetical protein
VHRLQHRNPEFQHRIERRTAALGGVPRYLRGGKISTEDLEIHRRGELLQRIAPLRDLPQPMLDLPEPSLPTRHTRLIRHPLKAMESCRGAQGQRVAGGVQVSREAKHRCGIVGNFPDVGAIVCLVDEITLEGSNEWAVAPCDKGLETLARVTNTASIRPPAVAT